jgi:multidrug transporter EmrE-like cation transporter
VSTLFAALLSIVLSVAAQFLLKAGMSGAAIRQTLAAPFSVQTIWTVMSDARVLGGFLLYGLGAAVWLTVLSKWDVSKAYPMVGLGFAATVAIGFLAGENVTALRVAGVALICLGIFAIIRS